MRKSLYSWCRLHPGILLPRASPDLDATSGSSDGRLRWLVNRQVADGNHDRAIFILDGETFFLTVSSRYHTKINLHILIASICQWFHPDAQGRKGEMLGFSDDGP